MGVKDLDQIQYGRRFWWFSSEPALTVSEGWSGFKNAVNPGFKINSIFMSKSYWEMSPTV